VPEGYTGLYRKRTRRLKGDNEDNALARQISLAIICSAAVHGIESSAATKAPNVPPTQSPSEVPSRTASRLLAP
jgi:hypothetical protein